MISTSATRGLGKLGIGAVIAAAVVALGTACSSEIDGAHAKPTSSSTSTEETLVSEPPSSTSASQAPADPKPLLTTSWTDQDGSSFELTIHKIAGSAEIDPDNGAPGEVLIRPTLTVSGHLTNTTKQKEAKLPRIYVQPYWKSTNPVCKSRDDLTGRPSIAEIRTIGDNRMCSPMSGPIVFEHPLANRSSIGTPMDPDSRLFVTAGGAWPKVTVAEADAPMIAEALKTPDDLLFARTLTMSTAVPPAERCQLKTGDVWVFAESSPGMSGCWVEDSSATTSAAQGKDLPVCILNAGSTTGLTSRYQDQLVAAGFEIAETGNMSTSSIVENTIFYPAGRENEAQALAAEVPSMIAERPATLTRCPNGLALIVIN